MKRSSNGFNLFGVFIAVVVMALAATLKAAPEAETAGGDVEVATQITQ